MRKQLLISIAILLFLLIATTIVVLYGKGYRFWFEKGKPDISGTGLLVATSKPDGAQVFVNDHLATATDSTINLSPGEYSIRVYKDGYFPWRKKIKIEKEVVAKIDATLFPTAPKLDSITNTGVENPRVDPTTTQIVYTISSSSASKNGVWVLDMAERSLLTLQSGTKQIADDSNDTLSKATFTWSPDGKQLVASISATLSRSAAWYLLETSSFNESPRNVTTTLVSIFAAWENERREKEASRLTALKKPLRKVIEENFAAAKWSSDETKILYTASQSATIPIIIKPPLIGTNQTPEERDIKKDSVYVYDIKEDKNYKIEIGNWLPDSKHLLLVKEKKVHIIEYDGGNDTIVYAGPFIDDYVFPFSNESKIVMLTNLGNPDIPANLYTLGLE